MLEISTKISAIGSYVYSIFAKMKEMSAKEAWEHSVDISQTNLLKEDLDIIKDFRKNYVLISLITKLNTITNPANVVIIA